MIKHDDKIKSVNNQEHRLGPTTEEWAASAETSGKWLFANARFEGKVQISAYHTSGEYVFQEQQIETGVDLLSLGHTANHRVSMGGDEVGNILNEVAKTFYTDSNVIEVYGVLTGTEMDIFLVLKEEVSQMALKIANLQLEVIEKIPSYQLEVNYFTTDYFTEDYLPEGSIRILRRN